MAHIYPSDIYCAECGAQMFRQRRKAFFPQVVSCANEQCSLYGKKYKLFPKFLEGEEYIEEAS